MSRIGTEGFAVTQKMKWQTLVNLAGNDWESLIAITPVDSSF